MSEYKEIDLGMEFSLAVGIRSDSGSVRNEVELMRGNGISEKVFLKRLPDKPFTWMGNVLAVAIKSLHGETIAADAREEYIKEGSITIPSLILKMPLCDANTTLLEVHRRLWQNLMPRQQCLCKFCGNDFVMDIDLNRIEHSEENLAFIEHISTVPNPLELIADLKGGFEFKPFQKNGTEGFKHEEFRGHYNRLVYRVPTLGDAIRSEKHAKDDVTFWRKIAYDCLLRIERVENRNTPQEEVMMTLPKEVNTFIGTRLYDQHLDSRDLKIVRDELKEKLPTMPFGYPEQCPTCNRTTPVAMEASGFFSV